MPSFKREYIILEVVADAFAFVKGDKPARSISCLLLQDSRYPIRHMASARLISW